MKMAYLLLVMAFACLCCSVRGQSCSCPTEDTSDVLKAETDGDESLILANYDEDLKKDTTNAAETLESLNTTQDDDDVEKKARSANDALSVKWGGFTIDWKLCPTWTGWYWYWWAPRPRCRVLQPVHVTKCKTRSCQFVPNFPFFRFYCRQQYSWQRVFVYCPFSWPRFRYIWVRVPCGCSCSRYYCWINELTSVTTRG